MQRQILRPAAIGIAVILPVLGSREVRGSYIADDIAGLLIIRLLLWGVVDDVAGIFCQLTPYQQLLYGVGDSMSVRGEVGEVGEGAAPIAST